MKIEFAARFSFVTSTAKRYMYGDDEGERNFWRKTSGEEGENGRDQKPKDKVEEEAARWESITVLCTEIRY